MEDPFQHFYVRTWSDGKTNRYVKGGLMLLNGEKHPDDYGKEEWKTGISEGIFESGIKIPDINHWSEFLKGLGYGFQF